MALNLELKVHLEQFDYRYHSSKVEFFVRFLGELKIPKRHFEINWPLPISKGYFNCKLYHTHSFKNKQTDLINKAETF